MPIASDNKTGRLAFSYRLLFDKNPLPMYVYDVKTLCMLAVNEAALEKFGYSEPDFLGLTLLDLHHVDEAEELKVYLTLPEDNRLRAKSELWRHRHRNGDIFLVETVTGMFEHIGIQARMVLVRDVTEQRTAQQTQQAMTRRLADTLEHVTDGFFELDTEWRIVALNSRGAALLGHPREVLLGQKIVELLPEVRGSIFHTEFARAMEQGQPSSFQANYPADGGLRKVHVIPSEKGIAVYFRNVTEARVPEKSLLVERETLAAVVAATGDALITTDPQGRITLFNPGAERIFGCQAAAMLGQPLDKLMPARFRSAHAGHQLRFLESGGAQRAMGMGVVKGLRADGQEVELEGKIFQVSIDQQVVQIACLADVTERNQAAAQVEHARTQMAQLTHRLMSQEKTLVKRLGQVLHDQLGQTVAAIRMAHETVMALQGDKVAPKVARMQAQMGMLIGQAVQQVRQVLVDLRPPLLEEQGLVAALDNELRNRALTHPEVDISVFAEQQVEEARWPVDVEYAAFMVAREAVENALRHSGATHIAVHVTGQGPVLELQVRDDGSGFFLDTGHRVGHLGLLDMRERANIVGAQLELGPQAPSGTRVTFHWEAAP